MMHRKTWLIALIGLTGCGQGWAPGEGRTERQGAEAKNAAPLPLQGGGGASAIAANTAHAGSQPAAEAPRECDCHGDKGVPPRVESVDVSGLDLASSPARGSATAPVTMLVYCDFECPYCRRAQVTLDELEKTYGPALRIVFKQLPLPMHEQARLAAKASLAAHDQGRFWQLHDLMLKESKLTPVGIEQLATQAGLDLGRFRAALASPALEARLEREAADAARVGARGTPTFVVNGKKVVGAQPVEVFKQLIDEALGSAL